MTHTKRQWTTPQLIVLARGTPAESVLVACKTMNPNQAQDGPNDFVLQDTCAAGPDYDNCSPCHARPVADT